VTNDWTHNFIPLHIVYIYCYECFIYDCLFYGFWDFKFLSLNLFGRTWIQKIFYLCFYLKRYLFRIKLSFKLHKICKYIQYYQLVYSWISNLLNTYLNLCILYILYSMVYVSYNIILCIFIKYTYIVYNCFYKFIFLKCIVQKHFKYLNWIHCTKKILYKLYIHHNILWKKIKCSII